MHARRGDSRAQGKNQKVPVEWEQELDPSPRRAAQRYGPAASRGAYHRAAPRTAATAHSLLLAAWAALWISTCDRGPMRGPAARPGIVARPDRSSCLPPCPCPPLVVSHEHTSPFFFPSPPARSDFLHPSRSCPVLCHRPPPFPAAKKLCYCTGRQHQRGRLVASPHSSSILFFSLGHRGPHSWPLRTTQACGAHPVFDSL